MGIQGLLPLLSSIAEPVHVSKYAHTKVAIDGYCWLYRGAYAYAQDVCLANTSAGYMKLLLRRVSMLKQYGVIPVVVFDGDDLPQKASTNRRRAESRKENRDAGCRLLKEGKRKEARKAFVKGIHITLDMAYATMGELKKANVEYVVAPYEADAQLAHLIQTGYVSAIISEDSDLLVFGCDRVLFKVDDEGHGQELLLGRLGQTRSVDLHGWTQEMFQLMCILSGCDYIDSLPGIGLKAAHSIVKRSKSLQAVIRRLQLDHNCSDMYISQFIRAFVTFRHQRVFSPSMHCVTELRSLDSQHEALQAMMQQYAPEPDTVCTFDFLGKVHPASIAVQISTGCINPKTLASYTSRLKTEPKKEHGDRIDLSARVTSRYFSSPGPKRRRLSIRHMLTRPETCSTPSILFRE